MKVTVELPDEIVEELIKDHLKDGEPVAEKIVRLVECGLKVYNLFISGHNILATRDDLNSRSFQYLQDKNWIFKAIEK